MRKLFLLSLLIPALATAQIPTYQGNASSEILHEIQKLQNTGKVLYLAAHPDDENTRLIAWLENGAKYETAYLSLTRGDGGQNLIGDELGSELGLLRTQELLRARATDGGQQFFTRAVDFGYSKNPEETFEIWGKEEILKDVVRVIRTFKPDYIITRFPPNSRAGHGHHTASAILAEEAMEAAANPKEFKELESFGLYPHQTKSLYHNTSTWWDKTLPEQAQTNDSILEVNVGGYDPLLGKSYNEIAALSRSKHRCQGFGARLQRGDQMEYLQYVKGEFIREPFKPISWSEALGMSEFDETLETLIQTWSPSDMKSNLSDLVNLREMLLKASGNANPIISRKLNQLDEVILKTAGFHGSAQAESWFIALNDPNTVAIDLNWMCRTVDFNLKSYQIQEGRTVFLEEETPANTQGVAKLDVLVEDFFKSVSHPYWLKQSPNGRYYVENESMIGVPEGPFAGKITLVLEIMGQSISVDLPITYSWVDRADGELIRNALVVPDFTAKFSEPTYIFNPEGSQEVLVQVHGFTEGKAILRLNLPEGWTSEPQELEIEFKEVNTSQTHGFTVYPGVLTGKESLEAEVVFQGETYHRAFVEIAYPHIPTQVYFPENRVQALNLDLKTKGEKIGYIVGAGDRVPKALEQMGYEVVLITEESMAQTNLSDFDALVSGIRAYNTQSWLKDYKTQILNYVSEGGLYLVQYNTSRGIQGEWFSPYKIELGRGRVTDETAPVGFTNESHPVLLKPNPLSASDFDGWVQERGLYFASEWGPEYKSVFIMNDPGESPEEGSLLIADYGEGAIVYSGISFFRELPAGVPGAFKLMANILSYKM